MVVAALGLNHFWQFVFDNSTLTLASYNAVRFLCYAAIGIWSVPDPQIGKNRLAAVVLIVTVLDHLLGRSLNLLAAYWGTNVPLTSLLYQSIDVLVASYVFFAILALLTAFASAFLYRKFAQR